MQACRRNEIETPNWGKNYKIWKSFQQNIQYTQQHYQRFFSSFYRVTTKQIDVHRSKNKKSVPQKFFLKKYAIKFWNFEIFFSYTSLL